MAADRLEIDPEVLERLPGSVLMELVDAREHTVLYCSACAGAVAPESPAPMSVLFLEDPHGEAVLRYAHTACRHSGVYPHEGPLTTPASVPLTWQAVLREHRVPAVLLWESAYSVHAGAGGELALANYRAGGFWAPEADLSDLDPPEARRYRLRRGPEGLELHGPSAVSDRFALGGGAASQDWLDALERTRRCLLVFGVGLGLERRSWQRVADVLQAGAAVTAVVRLSSARGR